MIRLPSWNDPSCPNSSVHLLNTTQKTAPKGNPYLSLNIPIIAWLNYLSASSKIFTTRCPAHYMSRSSYYYWNAVLTSLFCCRDTFTAICNAAACVAHLNYAKRSLACWGPSLSKYIWDAIYHLQKDNLQIIWMFVKIVLAMGPKKN